MIDKRTLEFILADQQEELEARANETLCRRAEEKTVDLKSTQAQVVISARMLLLARTSVIGLKPLLPSTFIGNARCRAWTSTI